MPSMGLQNLALGAIIPLAQASNVQGLLSKRDDGDNLTTAHGTIASLAWFLFLIGAILMHVLNGPKTWLVHAGTQALGLLFLVVGAGMGINLAMTSNQLDSAHAIIGLILFASIWLIAAGGFLQHLAYRKHQRRTVIGHVHMWVGRSLITLALINGGLGLQLAGEHGGDVIAYGVVAGVVWLAWVGITFFWPSKGKQMNA